MSVLGSEILEDIKNMPELWSKYYFGASFYGVQKGDIVVSGYGNSAILSIIDIYIDGKAVPSSYMDKFRLEKAIGKWLKNVTLKQLKD